MAVFCDFNKDLRKILIDMFRQISYPVDDSASTEELYLRKLTILRRELPTIKWNIHLSTILRVKFFSPAIWLGLQVIIEKAQQGENLNNHLSDKVTHPSKYKDLLMNDWGINHFHLGVFPDKKIKRFVERTGELLFFRTVEENMYLIDILPHNNFTNKNLLEVTLSNWPKIMIPYRMQGQEGTSFTEDQLKKLRMKKMNAAHKLSDGYGYRPMGGGFTFSGHNIADIKKREYFFNNLKLLKEQLELHEELIIKNIREKTGKALKNLNLQLTAEADSYWLIEQESNERLNPEKFVK